MSLWIFIILIIVVFFLGYLALLILTDEREFLIIYGQIFCMVLLIGSIVYSDLYDKAESTNINITLSRLQISYLCGANAAISADFNYKGDANPYITCSTDAKVSVKDYPEIVFKGLLALNHDHSDKDKKPFSLDDVKKAFVDIYGLKPQEVNLDKKDELIKKAQISLANAKGQ